MKKDRMPSFLRVILKLISVLIALGLILCISAWWVINHFNSPPGIPYAADKSDSSLRIEEGTLILEVRSGESAQSVGKRLENANIIRSQFFWQLLSRFKNEHIKTGTYRIELPATQLKIHSVLVSGEQILIRVTIPEGVTLKKAARILEDAKICNADDFLTAASNPGLIEQYKIPGNTMEGYLFPDTYFFPYSFPAERVVRTMADTFFSRLAIIYPEALALTNEEIFNRIILASIVEREYKIDEEAALMAGVFENRLRINMRLESCATVEYIITEIQGKPHPKVLYFRDLEIVDPYNTYMYRGLPPGPISAPGSVAINAAFNPATTNFLYFRLTDPDAGRHYFSRTLDEHNQAGILYLRGY